MYNHSIQFYKFAIFGRSGRLALYAFICGLFVGCSQLPVKIGVDDEISSGEVEPAPLSVPAVSNVSKTGEPQDTKESPFDLDLDLDKQKQNELDLALKRLEQYRIKFGTNDTLLEAEAILKQSIATNRINTQTSELEP